MITSLSVTADGLGGLSKNLTIKPAEAYPNETQFVELPEEIVVNDTIKVKVEVRDEFKNVRADSNDVVKIRISKTNGINDLPDIERKDFREGLHVFELMFQDGDGGDYKLNLEVNGANKTGSAESLTVKETLDTPKNIQILNNPIEVTAGEIITDFPTVEVTNRNDEPLEGVTVHISLEEGEFYQGNTIIETDGDGIAIFNNLKITVAGTYKLKFQVESQDNIVVESNEFKITPAQPNHIEINIDQTNSDFVAGNFIHPPPEIIVKDQFDNPVPGVSVNVVLVDEWNTVIDNGFTNDNDTTIETDGDGIAIFNNLQITAAGTYKLRFEASGLHKEINLFSINPGNPDQLEINIGQTYFDFDAGDFIDPPPEIKVQDQFDNPVPGVSVDVVLVDEWNTVIDNGFTNDNDTTIETDGDGIATFNNLKITTVGTYKLRFEASGLIEENNLFNINASDPHKIRLISRHPQNISLGNTVSPSPELKVEDEFANPVPGISVIVTLLDELGNVVGSLSDDSETIVETNYLGNVIFNYLIIKETGFYKLRFEHQNNQSVELETKPFEVS